MYVEIVDKMTNRVVKRMGPMSEQKANSVMAGASFNLNHDKYLIRIVNK